MIQSTNVENKKNSYIPLFLPEKTDFIKVSDMQWVWVLCTCPYHDSII